MREKGELGEDDWELLFTFTEISREARVVMFLFW
jgi:hypothetical protein